MELKLSDFEISPTVPPDEMARRIRLAFKRMPGWQDTYFSTTQAIRQVEVEDGELTDKVL